MGRLSKLNPLPLHAEKIPQSTENPIMSSRAEEDTKSQFQSVFANSHPIDMMEMS